MRTAIAVSCLGVLVCAACGGPPPPPFKPVADVKQLVQGAIDPNADIIWEATGTIVSKAGIENRRPKNQEQWDAVRNSAIVLTEAGRLLMMAPRAKDGDMWMKRSREMIDTGLAAWRELPKPRTSINSSPLAATSTTPAHTVTRTTWTRSRTPTGELTLTT
jgi:hypothetical protein